MSEKASSVFAALAAAKAKVASTNKFLSEPIHRMDEESLSDEEESLQAHAPLQAGVIGSSVAGDTSDAYTRLAAAREKVAGTNEFLSVSAHMREESSDEEGPLQAHARSPEGKPIGLGTAKGNAEELARRLEEPARLLGDDIEQFKKLDKLLRRTQPKAYRAREISVERI